MFYESTRGQEKSIKSSQAIVNGIAKDGGLYVPTVFPDVKNDLEKLQNLNYMELAEYILGLYLTDFAKSDVAKSIKYAYEKNFEEGKVCTVKRVGEEWFMELYHGPTMAFKDVALTLLPQILRTASDNLGIADDIVILTATSGDTGKAALEGFKDVLGTKIIVFYPQDGVSSFQKLQMTTQEGKNTHVVGLKGNFDDTQTGVKTLFGDLNFKLSLKRKGMILSSANSINIGRLLPQIVYYFYSYFECVKSGKVKFGDKVNFTVPTGNFGDILAGYYAKRMGLPVNKLICASNDNKVLYDFFKTGEYDAHRPFVKTTSPSMDILISSNLERLLYEASGRDCERIAKLMKEMHDDRRFKIDDDMMKNLSDFSGGYASEDDVKKAIHDVFENSGYLMDTHTAVAYSVYERYKKETGDDSPSVIVSTASPYKFAKSVSDALCMEKVDNEDDFQLIDRLSKKCKLSVPESVNRLKEKKVIHTMTCTSETMKSSVLDILGVDEI